MKLSKVFKHFNVVKEDIDNRQDNKIDYSLNITVNDGKFKANGKAEGLRVPKKVSANIVCVEDVINFIINEETKNSKITNTEGVSNKDILSQMLFAFIDKENAKYLNTKDSISFSFDYGPSPNNCIGLLITKAIGSPMFSIIMRLNKKALPNQFNKEAMNSQILTYSSVSATDNNTGI